MATLNRVEADDFSWNVPGPARRAGHRADPQPAQAPAGQLRARPRPGPRLPGRRAAGGGAAARRARAVVRGPPPGWSCRARRGTGRRCRRTCSPPTASSTTAGAEQARGQGPRRAQGAAAAAVRRSAIAEVAADSGLARTGETDWVFGTCEESFTGPGPAMRCGPSRPASTRERTRRPRRLRLGRRAGRAAPARRTSAAAARRPTPPAARACWRPWTTRAEAGPGRLAVLLGAPSCSRTAWAAVLATWSTPGRRFGTRPPSTRSSARRPRAREALRRVVTDAGRRPRGRWREADRVLSGRAD